MPAHWSRLRGWHRHHCSICVCARRSYDNTSGRSRPCGDTNQLAEDQTHGYHPTPKNICHWRYATTKYCLSTPSHILDPWSRMMGLSLVTLHLALPRLPLPCVTYQIHCFANTASAYELRSTCIVPWFSPFCFTSRCVYSLTRVDLDCDYLHTPCLYMLYYTLGPFEALRS